MAGVRNTCIARGIVSAAGYPVLYTVPPGYTLLLKSVAVTSTAPAALTARPFLYSPPSTANIYLAAQSVNPNTGYAWNGWVAVNAGDQVGLGTDGAPLHYWLSGAVLPNAP